MNEKLQLRLKYLITLSYRFLTKSYRDTSNETNGLSGKKTLLLRRLADKEGEGGE